MVKWYVIGGVVFAIMFFLFGWFVHKALEPDVPARVEIIDRVRVDTVKVEKEIYITNTKTITKIERDTVFADEKVTERIYTDSLQGVQENVDYKISHTIIDSDSVYSFWDVKIKQLETYIKETTTRDSITTVVEYKYLSKPFFLDTWFYTTLVSLGLIILAIVF